MSVEVVRYNNDYLAELTIFCNKCKELGWENNASPEAMKVDDPNVQFWLIFIDGEVASVGGAQKLYPKDADCIIQEDDFRVYYRAATLPKYYNYHPFNRYMGHNLYIKHLSRPSFRWCWERGAKRLFLTANTTNVGSPHMDKIAKVTRLNAVDYCRKRGIPPIWTELGNCNLFYTQQDVFQIIDENFPWWIEKGGFTDGDY